MERFRRNISPPDRSRSGLVATDEITQGRKRPSIGRAAESFQSKLIASLKSVRKRGDDYGQKTRYVILIKRLAILSAA